MSGSKTRQLAEQETPQPQQSCQPLTAAPGQQVAASLSATGAEEELPDTDLTREEFLAEWKQLCEGESAASQDFDKTILTLATGALGLSFAFLGQILKAPPVGKWVLCGAWGCFIVSMCSILVSMRTSQSAFRQSREILEAIYFREVGARERKSSSSLATERLNMLSLVTLILGLVALAVFVFLNLLR